MNTEEFEDDLEDEVIEARKRFSRLARRAPSGWRGQVDHLVDHLEELEDELAESEHDSDDA